MVNSSFSTLFLLPCRASNRHLATDVWPWVVTFEGEIFVIEAEYVMHIGIDVHTWQRTRSTRQLFFDLLEMVGIDMRVAKCMHKIAGTQPGDLRHHLQQQRIGSDIERDTKKNVGTALIELQTKPAIGDIKLEQRVARWQIHATEVGNIPRAHYNAARVGIILYGINHLRDLVDVPAIIVGPRTPLVSVYVSEVSIGVGPFVPYPHPVLLQIMHIGVATQEPQQLIYYRFQVQLFSSQQRETVVEVETHLVAKHATSAGAGTVGLEHSVIAHMAQQVEILFHV